MRRIYDLNWNEKFSIIKYFGLVDERACRIFRVSLDELNEAKQKIKKVLIQEDTNFNPNDYKIYVLYDLTRFKDKEGTSPFTNKKRKKRKIRKHKEKSINLNTHRGRVRDAINKIPQYPTPLDEFLKEHNVSIYSIKKWRKYIGPGKQGVVRFRRNRMTNKVVIWYDL